MSVLQVFGNAIETTWRRKLGFDVKGSFPSEPLGSMTANDKAAAAEQTALFERLEPMLRQGAPPMLLCCDQPAQHMLLAA